MRLDNSVNLIAVLWIGCVVWIADAKEEEFPDSNMMNLPDVSLEEMRTGDVGDAIIVGPKRGDSKKSKEWFVGGRKLTEKEMERIEKYQTPEAERIGGLTPAQQQKEWEGALERDPNKVEVDEGSTLLERLFGVDEGEGRERESLEGVYR